MQLLFILVALLRLGNAGETCSSFYAQSKVEPKDCPRIVQGAFCKGARCTKDDKDACCTIAKPTSGAATGPKTLGGRECWGPFEWLNTEWDGGCICGNDVGTSGFEDCFKNKGKDGDEVSAPWCPLVPGTITKNPKEDKEKTWGWCAEAGFKGATGKLKTKKSESSVQATLSLNSVPHLKIMVFGLVLLFSATFYAYCSRKNSGDIYEAIVDDEEYGNE